MVRGAAALITLTLLQARTGSAVRVIPREASTISLSEHADASLSKTKLLQPFLARVGLTVAEASEGLPSFVELEQLAKNSCSLGSFAALAAAKDTAGGSHWLVRAQSGSLVHVSSSEAAGVHFRPASACAPSSLLEAEDAPKLTAQAELMLPTNPEAVKSLKYAMQILKEKTYSCKRGNQVGSATLLSAQSAIVDGLKITLTLRMRAMWLMEEVDTYHRLDVVWQTRENDLVPHIIMPRYPNGTEVAWCELMKVTTERALLELASKEGHEKVADYHQKLGYLGSYLDGGVGPDSLLEKAETAQCVGSGSLPKDFSYRGHATHGRCVNKEAVMNQGGCGSCWAFAVSHAASARACMQYPEAIAPAEGRKQFAVQEILSCNTAQEGCEGGWMATGFDTYRKGIPWSADYPYSPRGASFPWHSLGLQCQWGEKLKPFISDAPYSLQANVAAYQAELFCNGPFTVAFDVYENFFSFFSTPATKTAVYATTANTNQAGGHAVTLVGWGVQSSVPYWSIMNSWGSDWADEGFFKMLRGQNFCGIESWSVAAKIRKSPANWVYSDWQPCLNGKRTRGIKCVSSDDGNTIMEDSNCPIVDSWPEKSTFPRNLPNTSTDYPELWPLAISYECQTGSTCPLSVCNGFGQVSRGPDGTCTCACLEGYAAPTCNTCTPGYQGYPTCRLKCTRAADCTNHGAAFGVKWKNEFGAWLDTCSCSCDAGWTGADCETPVSSTTGGTDTTAASTTQATTTPASTTLATTATTTAPRTTTRAPTTPTTTTTTATTTRSTRTTTTTTTRTTTTRAPRTTTTRTRRPRTQLGPGEAAESEAPLEVTSGLCTVDAAGCAQSPNFPHMYNMWQTCDIEVSGTRRISATAFDTAEGADILTINGQRFSGKTGPQDVEASGTITWYADTSVHRGWRICAV